jgi:glycerophosphoryl diester phosphodiesterase
MRTMRGEFLAAVVMLGGVAAAAAMVAAEDRSGPPSLDLQAHRGGLGLRPESSPAAFEHALRLGVTTLELDVQITWDGQAVVTHDRRVNPVVCRDTTPAFPGDPRFPYVGKLVKDLTLAQLKTLDCGTRRPADPRVDQFVDTQIPVPGSQIITLRELFDLVKRADAAGSEGVRLNIETKVEAGAPQETAPREQFVQVVIDEVRRAELIENVTIESFDWGALMRVREVEPRLPVIALIDENFLQTGQSGASPWLGGIDIDDFGGNPVQAVNSFGADVIAPVHGHPEDGSVLDPDYRPITTKEMVDEAHTVGIRVIPWGVNDIATMNRMIGIGVDGIITDYPDRLRDLLETRGYQLPRQFGLPG